MMKDEAKILRILRNYYGLILDEPPPRHLIDLIMNTPPTQHDDKSPGH